MNKRILDYNKISELFNTFQKKRLRARGDIAEKRLTKEEIAILKQDVETDSTSMQAMDIATEFYSSTRKLYAPS